MTDRQSNQKRQESKDSETSPDNGNGSWMERNFASIVGGGTFVLLALLTLFMYLMNN